MCSEYFDAGVDSGARNMLVEGDGGDRHACVVLKRSSGKQPLVDTILDAWIKVVAAQTAHVEVDQGQFSSDQDTRV